MSVRADWFGKGLLACMKNDVDVEADTLKLSLHTASYVPDLDAHDFYDDVTNELASGNGYNTGGETLAGKALSYDAASGQVRFDFNDITWSFTASKTWRYGVIRKARGGAASADELIALLPWSGNKTTSTTYPLILPAEGPLYLDRTP